MKIKRVTFLLGALLFGATLSANSQTIENREDYSWHYYGMETDCKNIESLIDIFYKQAYDSFKDVQATERSSQDSAGNVRTDYRYANARCLPNCSCVYTESENKNQLNITVVRSSNPLEVSQHYSPAVEQLVKCLGIDWTNKQTDADALKMRSDMRKRSFINEYIFTYNLNDKLVLKYPDIKVVAYRDNTSYEYVIEIQLIK